MFGTVSNPEDVLGDLGRLVLAYVLTLGMGWESEAESHAAGIRTFPIVSMASCGYLLLLGPRPDVAAQSRLLQGLITGIGFIGAGAILRQGPKVRGTATAASVWNAAVIGAAVAMNHVILAVALAALNVFTLYVLLPLKKRITDKEG
jgi:putative Mg2+ transporter-C (MgtC) family protein